MVQVVVLSSLSAFELASYDYGNITEYDSTRYAIKGSGRILRSKMGGFFSIPVCNISTTKDRRGGLTVSAVHPQSSDGYNSRPIRRKLGCNWWPIDDYIGVHCCSAGDEF